MRKAIISSIIILMLSIVGVSATVYHIGDTVNFETSIEPKCGGFCSGIDPGLGCNTFSTKESCNAQTEGCSWVDATTPVCDTDLTDNDGLFLYGGYALKDSDGTIRMQVNPTDICSTTPYTASASFIVDKLGTWKFCSKAYALQVNYADNKCSSSIKDCDMEQCQDITVVENCQKDEAPVVQSFTSWLNSW